MKQVSNKIMSNTNISYFRPKLLFLVGLFLTLVILWPMFTAPYFSHHDDVQIIRLYEMNQCFKDFQIPCRWVPDLGGQLGYPLFNYYAPLPYYVGELFYLTSGNLIISAKIMFGLSMAGAYIFMYLLARKFWGNLGGVLSGIFYVYAPYHAVDLYVRGAMGELWGLMFFPLVFLGFFKLRSSQALGSILLFSLSLAGLMLSHNLSSLIFMPVILLFTIIFIIIDRNVNFVKAVIVSLALGLSLSAFYWIPMILEQQYVHVNTIISGYFSYTEHFKGLRKLFLDYSWGWGSSVREVPGGDKDGLSFQIGFTHVLGWLFSMCASVLLWKRNKILSLLVIISSLIILLSIFMIHPLSYQVWNLLTPIRFLQFPWRLLTLIIFFISFIVGCIPFVLSKQEKINNRLFLLIYGGIVLIVIFSNFWYFRPEKFVYINDQEALSGLRWDEQIKRSIFDYLPIYAKEPPAELVFERYKILSGDTKVSGFQSGSDWIYFRASAESLSFIQVSQYFFPDWKLKIDGNDVKINHENKFGLITFAIDPGEHQIELKLHNTPIRYLANIVSIFGLVILAVVLIFLIKPIKNIFVYLVSGFK